jgi:hypothetical protein
MQMEGRGAGDGLTWAMTMRLEVRQMPDTPLELSREELGRVCKNVFASDFADALAVRHPKDAHAVTLARLLTPEGACQLSRVDKLRALPTALLDAVQRHVRD